MSETPTTSVVATAPVPSVQPVNDIPPQELKKVLMDRARTMGIKFSPNISVELLRERINAKLDGAQDPEEHDEEEDEEDDEPLQMKNEEKPMTETQKENAKRSKIQKEALKLVRVRVTCLNPHKKDLPGEIFTIGNRYIGTVKKYVPFGEQTDGGYHIPNCIFEHMKSRKFTQIRTKSKSNRPEETLIETSDVPEFAIEVLPPLTPKELKELAQRQAMASGTTAAA